jgi:hypothetical protein
MAKMYPKQLLAQTQSAAERRIFGLLESQLPDDFTVFHSVAWLSRMRGGQAYDGETDFLVAHRELGILVVEVKGGQIEYDGVTRSWFSTDRNNKRHKLSKDPLDQAKSARYNLYGKLTDAPLTRKYHYKVFHALCFPDVTVEHDLRVDLPSDIVIDQQDLTDIENAIRNIFKYWDHGEEHNAPGTQGIHALVELLAPTFELRSFLGSELQVQTQEIKHLTEQQFMALDLLSREPKAIIYGCAGSGKTLLALEKTRRLANEGYSVIFTCFNSKLADYLNRTQYTREEVRIANFHELCLDLARKARINVPPLESDAVLGDSDFYFESVLPQTLMEATKKIGPQYNALIVDEAQDFRPSWWIALDSLLIDPGQNTFYIFCDDNQNIYAGRELEYPFRTPSVTLTRNCRNTRQIHEIVAKYYHGGSQIHSQGPDGRKPQFIDVNHPDDLTAILRSQLHILIRREKVQPEDIVVLTPRSQRNSKLEEGKQLGNFILTWKPRSRKDQIECSTIHSFKGLERPIVILVELDHLKQDDKDLLTYIAVSRACNHLIVLGHLPLRDSKA